MASCRVGLTLWPSRKAVKVTLADNSHDKGALLKCSSDVACKMFGRNSPSAWYSTTTKRTARLVCVTRKYTADRLCLMSYLSTPPPPRAPTAGRVTCTTLRSTPAAIAVFDSIAVGAY